MSLPQKIFAEFLLTDLYLNERFLTFLENAGGRFECSKSQQMTKVVDILSVPFSEDDSNTVKSIIFNPEIRNKRDFHNERLTQVLHQVSCQVFYYFRHKGSMRIKEVQSLSVFDCFGILQ